MITLFYLWSTNYGSTCSKKVLAPSLQHQKNKQKNNSNLYWSAVLSTICSVCGLEGEKKKSTHTKQSRSFTSKGSVAEESNSTGMFLDSGTWAFIKIQVDQDEKEKVTVFL